MGQALFWLGILAFGGLLGILLYALQPPVVPGTVWNSIGNILSIFGAGSLIAAASFFFGGLLGFLFGIPRAIRPISQESSGDQTAPKKGEEFTRNVGYYQANSNLIEISDWLTKIIVGVGLVSLLAIPGKLQEYGSWIAPALGGYSSSAAFGLAILISYSLIGFLFAYLSTSQYLEMEWERKMQQELREKIAAIDERMTELEKEFNKMEAIDKKAVIAATSILKHNLEVKDLDKIIAAASPDTREKISNLAQNEIYNIDTMERTIPVFKALIAADEKNMRNYIFLGEVLRDKPEPAFNESEKVFTMAIEKRDELKLDDYHLLEGHRAITKIKRNKGWKKEDWDKSDLKTSILDDLARAVQEEIFYEFFQYNKDLKSWMEENKLSIDDVKSKLG